MRVAIVYDAQLPVKAYGGTERIAWWLAKGLRELGVEVTLACSPGSHCPFADVVSPNFSDRIETQTKADIYHYFATPAYSPEKPCIVTIHGNGRLDEVFHPNTVFISRDHARRHSAECFVYNGLDPAEYRYCEEKGDSLVFLAKASWRVKNVRGAIRYARRAGRPLRIVGGSRWWMPRWRGVSWEGMVGGKEKADILAGARALLFPVIWNEPFGIAVIEALVSGTPVVASRNGSMPELVPETVGFTCGTESEMVAAIERASEIRPSRCREWVLQNFHYQKMAAGYLTIYQCVLDGERINREIPRATEPPQKLFPIVG